MINIVHLHMVYSNYKTGIDRYLEMFRHGIQKQASWIKSHSIFLDNDEKKFFYRIKNDGGILSAFLPMPKNELLYKDLFWKKKYIQMVLEILTPYLSHLPHLVFQYHNLFLPELAMEMKERFGGKVITHLHCIPWKFNLNNNPSKFNKLYQLYLDEKYEDFKQVEMSGHNFNHADMIICLSKAAKEYLVNIHQVETKKIKIIQNGLNIEKNELVCERNTSEVEILYVGKISKDKGTFDMLDALKAIKEQGHNFKLKMAGTISSQHMTKIKTTYQTLDIDILGEISFIELQKLYTSCTIGIIPSLHEQCSYVAIEMSMFGVPMIVSDVDALSEMFEHEKTALLTPLFFDQDFGINADKNKFAQHIIRLIKDEKLRQSLSKNVRELYWKKFTLDRMMHETLEVYQLLK